MFGFSAPKQRPGRRLNARAVNRPAAEAERQSRARPGTGLAAIEAAGSRLDYSTSRRTWLIRITAVGTSSAQLGSYAWQAIYAVPGSPGTFADVTGLSGALGGDAFWEINGNSSLAVGTRVEVYREYYSGQVRGQYATC